MGVVSHWADHMLCCVDTAPRANIGHKTETRRDIVGNNYSKICVVYRPTLYKFSANEFLIISDNIIIGIENDIISKRRLFLKAN